LRRIFFAGREPIAIELKKKDSDDKPCPFVAAYEGIIANDPSGIGGRHTDDVRITRICQVLAIFGVPCLIMNDNGRYHS
jgi:hypothetical protein